MALNRHWSCNNGCRSRLINADFAAAAVLISFGAVLGKTSPVQLVMMTMFEIALYHLNSWIGVKYFKVGYFRSEGSRAYDDSLSKSVLISDRMYHRLCPKLAESRVCQSSATMQNIEFF